MTGSQETRVLGIDPGLNITGYGVISICDREISVVEAGVVRSKRTDSFPTRLNSIHQGITDVIEQLKPDCVGLEDLYSHYERPQTAIIMGHARGVISLAVGQNELPLHGYAEKQIKKVLTGNGRAPKVQVQHAVARQLNLREIPEPADVADALAIALCHYFLTLRTATLT